MKTALGDAPEGVVHVVSRFMGRAWFLHDDVERHHYLRLLGIALDSSDARCIAYALMTNHLHLAMVGRTDSLIAWVNRINSSFALWMNHRHERLGPVFGGRPKQSAIPPAQAGRLLAYIHNNPVRAGLVAGARHSTWTSHRAYLGEVVTPRWLAVDEGLALAGLDARAFERWVDQHETTGRRVGVNRTGADVGDDEVTTYAIDLDRGLRCADDVATRDTVAIFDQRGAGGGLYTIGDEHRWWCAAPDLTILMSVVEGITGVPSARFGFPNPVPAVVWARKLVVRSALAMGLSVMDIAAPLGITLEGAIRIEREPVTAAERTMIDVVVQRLSVSA